jgi:hypothetical protein
LAAVLKRVALEAHDDVVDLCADALWLMVHPEEAAPSEASR